MRPLHAALLLAGLLALAAPIASGGGVVSERHTLGFTGYGNATALLESLLVNLSTGALSPQQASQAANLIANINASSAMSTGQGKASSSDLDSLYYYFKLSSNNITASDIYSAINSIGNEDLRQTLLGLLGRNITAADVSSALELLKAMKASGNLTDADYLLALKILSLVSASSGYAGLSREIDSEASKVAADLLSKLLGAPAGAAPASQAVSSAGAGPSLPSAPSLALPSLPQPLLSSIAVLGWASLAVLAALPLAYLARKKAAGLMEYPQARRLYEDAMERWGRAVAEYWRAVRAIELRHGIKRLPAQTHREYLEKARPALGPKAGAFEGLTRIYESRRFAGDSSPSLDSEASRLSRELV